VTVSVSLPSDYYVDVWKQRNPAVGGRPAPEPTPTDVQAIEEGVKSAVEDTVVGLLPVLQPEEDPYQQVKVTTYQSLAAVPPPAPAFSERALGWLADNWSTLGMISVGLCGLLMLRGMVRSNLPAPASPGQQRSAPSVAGQVDRANGEQDDAPPLRAHRPSIGQASPNLERELTEMVRENPDTAAAILRNWIGTSA
jgi:flagellar M-ring protein FliF